MNCECIKNITRANEWQLGPWFSLAYNHICQKGYKEAGMQGSAASMSGVSFDNIDTVLGLNFEREFHNRRVEGRRLRLFAKAGWRCNPKHSHSSCTAQIGGYDPFTPLLGGKTKHFFTATVGVRNKINDRVDLTANLSAIANRHYSYVNFSVGAGYSF
jgi:outer membrane autotransporter protein